MTSTLLQPVDIDGQPLAVGDRVTLVVGYPHFPYSGAEGQVTQLTGIQYGGAPAVFVKFDGDVDGVAAKGRSCRCTRFRKQHSLVGDLLAILTG